MRVTLAESATANVHAANMIAVPRTGPGKRRMVPRDSLDGLAVTLAAEVATAIAPQLVDKCRAVAERLVRARLDQLIGKL